MKKIMALVMVLILMLSVGAVAEDVSLMADYVVLPGEKPTFDLNGDGSEEIVYFDIAYDDVNYTETARDLARCMQEGKEVLTKRLLHGFADDEKLKLTEYMERMLRNMSEEGD